VSAPFATIPFAAHVGGIRGANDSTFCGPFLHIDSLLISYILFGVSNTRYLHILASNESNGFMGCFDILEVLEDSTSLGF
jgi:hypothetical protein